MKNNMTHEGIIIGNDNRVDKRFKSKEFFRETKRYYITSSGVKFDKIWYTTLGTWPLYRIKEGTLKKIGENK